MDPQYSHLKQSDTPLRDTETCWDNRWKHLSIITYA